MTKEEYDKIANAIFLLRETSTNEELEGITSSALLISYSFKKGDNEFNYKDFKNKCMHGVDNVV